MGANDDVLVYVDRADPGSQIIGKYNVQIYTMTII